MCSWPLRWTTWLMPRASLLPKRKKKKRRRERSWPGNPLSLECHPHWWEKELVLIPWPFWLNWTRVTLLQYFGSSRSSQPLLYSLCRDVAFPAQVQEVRGHPLGREAIETQGRDGVGGARCFGRKHNSISEIAAFSLFLHPWCVRKTA